MKHEIDMFGAGDICALGPAKPPAPDPLPSLTRCPIEITDGEVTEFDPNSGEAFARYVIEQPVKEAA